GGRLVLGTPDYANWQWVWMEKAYGLAAPGGYADEHIAHYTRAELTEIFAHRGFELDATRYIMKGELIMAFRKKSSATVRPGGDVLPRGTAGADQSHTRAASGFRRE
ncbi:hypothetical protein ACW2B4_18555, partial [Acinetobacter pittii]